MTQNTQVRHGQCRCATVTFKTNGPTLLTMACHCKGCQRMTASAFSLSEMYSSAHFEVTGGNPALGGMKAFPAHYVCPNCSSWVFTRVDTPMGEFVNVRATMFDDVQAGPPFIETCVAEKLDWVTIGAAHSFQKFPPPAEFSALIAQYGEKAL